MDKSAKSKSASKVFGTSIGKVSSKGPTRQINEDSIIVLEISGGSVESSAIGLYAIADGVGGCSHGEVASKVALIALARNVLDFFSGCGSDISEFYTKTIEKQRQEVKKMLGKAVESANKEVIYRGNILGSRISTTLAAIIIMNETCFIAGVGDTRVYIFRKDRLKQITRDDSIDGEKVKTDEITHQEARSYSKRRVVTKCLGQSEIMVNPLTKKLQNGDSLIICSDGLWENIGDDDILSIILKGEEPQAACDELLESALRKRVEDFDNISVIVIKVD